MRAKYAQDLVDTYAQLSKGYNLSHGQDVDVPILDKFLSLVSRQFPILDLGAGVGRDALYISNKGFSVTLLDISPEMLEVAKQRLKNATFICADLLEYNFPQDFYGGIWASMSLLHLTKEEMRIALVKLRTTLVNGGVIFCKMRTGNEEKVVESNKYGKPMKRFFAFYREDELVQYFETAGFTVLEHKSYQEDTPEPTILVVAKK